MNGRAKMIDIWAESCGFQGYLNFMRRRWNWSHTNVHKFGVSNWLKFAIGIGYTIIVLAIRCLSGLGFYARGRKVAKLRLKLKARY